MPHFKEIDDFLTQDCQGKFKDKSWFLGLFGSMIYTPTKEKVLQGFRYFACDTAPVIAACQSGNLADIAQLPFALDDDGDPDTGAVLINLYYTESGSMLALQVEEYQNSNPVPVTPVVLLEGPAAQSQIALVKKLDQSN